MERSISTGKGLGILLASLAVVGAVLFFVLNPEHPTWNAQPGSAPVASSPADDGSAAVLSRINSTSDCAALQREFDTAEVHFKQAKTAGDTARRELALKYMGAADERMKQIGCYGR